VGVRPIKVIGARSRCESEGTGGSMLGRTTTPASPGSTTI
jgi:hypothetical protein